VAKEKLSLLQHDELALGSPQQKYVVGTLLEHG
jgi:hypothetical protein